MYIDDIFQQQAAILDGAVARHTVQEKTGGIEALLKVLQTIGNGQRIKLKIEEMASRGVIAAIPAHEAADFRATTNTPALGVVGIDGSQIYPGDDEPIWGFVRAIATDGETTSEVCRMLEYDEVATEDGRLVKNATDAWREALEMEALIQSTQKPEWAGKVLLLDGSLLPWAIGRLLEKPAQIHQQHYLRANGQLIASVVDAPRSTMLLNLIKAGMSQPWEGGPIGDWAIADRMLEDGQRGAVFLHGSPQNSDLPAGAHVYFFLLKAGDQVLRVEIPEWVACDVNAVATVQASILANSISGYPIALMDAHYLVRIPEEVANSLRGQMKLRFAQVTGQFRQSAKERFKEGDRAAN